MGQEENWLAWTTGELTGLTHHFVKANYRNDVVFAAAF
jgi:hypothetical protein